MKRSGLWIQVGKESFNLADYPQGEFKVLVPKASRGTPNTISLALIYTVGNKRETKKVN